MIHPTAIIEPGARIGADCEIHAYAVIGKHAILGDRVTVHPFAVIGGEPQFLKFDSKIESFVRVGSGTVIREQVTINRSIYPGKETVVGENCFLMSTAHVGHDCAIGANVVVASQALLAGHVEIGSFAFVGGNASLHQFVRVGESVMIGGAGRLSRDVAPYTMVVERDEIVGLNLVGLKRRGLPRETIRELKEAFKRVYFEAGNIRELAAAAKASGEFKSPEAARFFDFFAVSKRNFARAVRTAVVDETE